MTGRAGTTSEPARLSTALARLGFYGNEQMPDKATFRADVSAEIADYIAAVRDAKALPPHVLIAGFFTEQTEFERRGTRALPPVIPLAQQGLQSQLAPDEGRRVQLWWTDRNREDAPLRPDETARLIRRAEWLGRVERVEHDRFTATVWDRSGPAVEQAQFFCEQLSRGDRGRLAVGAFFYWTVGYRENGLGERAGVSILQFQRRRRTPSPEHIEDARARTRKLLHVLHLPPDGAA